MDNSFNDSLNLNWYGDRQNAKKMWDSVKNAHSRIDKELKITKRPEALTVT